MKRFLAGWVLTMCTLSIFAQNKVIEVSGRVTEADTKEPVTQATVQLLSLPDSTYTSGVATGETGRFTLPKVAAGKYVLKVSYVGFHTKYVAVNLAANVTEKNLGTIALEADAVLLSEALVTAAAPEVVVREDTLEYNSAAYRTPEGAMLEELVKKLPGAEVSDDGTVTINGKEVKKIMVEGKEFFGGDVKTGMKNLPVTMVDKVKMYDKKSDLARITGIDDGEEETVLDLKVKKGMNQGWFGNIDLAIGTEDRYSSNLMLNRFVDGSQFSLIGSANNVNDQGFSGGGGGPRFRSNNGLTATKMIGANFATQTDKIEIGGSARFNYSDQDAISSNSSERFLTSSSSFSNSNSKNRNKNTSFNADFRMEWKPDTLTNIIFRPNFSYGKTDNSSFSHSGTFDADPLNYVTDPNNYLDLSAIGEDEDNDPLSDIALNRSNSNTLGKSNSLSTDASLQVNRKLNSMGRNITFRGSFSYGDNDNDSYSEMLNRYYSESMQSYLGGDSIEHRNQYVTTPSKNYSYSAQLTYSEPIARSTFLQFSYRFQHRYSDSDKRTYDLYLTDPDWSINNPLPAGYESNLVDSLGKKAEYYYNNHDISTSLRFIREKYQLSLGVSLQPQNTKLDYEKDEMDTVVRRTVVNFSPRIDFRYRFSQTSQLRFTYRGRASQPSMENLLDVTDNSNPLNIQRGNPGLKPSFAHNIRFDFNSYDGETQRGIMANADFSLTQNSVSNVTRYNSENGGVITSPENINGNWNASARLGFNKSLKDRRFSINTFSRIGYQNSVSYLYDNETMDNAKNRSTNLSLNEDLRGTFRNDWFELTLNGSIRYNFERNKLNPSNNQEPYTYGYGASTNITLPWNMSLSSNITNNARRGYRDSSMNRDEVIWNLQIAQSFLKGNAATISLQFNDLLKQQTNISRSLTSELRSVSEYNGITSYCMLHFIYRLNIFGNKEARRDMRRGGFDGGGPGEGPGGRSGGGRGGFGGGGPRF